MTDREMLEMAAKAAGYEVFGDQHPDDGLNILVGGRVYLWRPRHDDGDALRLAVKTKVLFGIQSAMGRLFLEEGDQPNVEAAVRRAIVRAAAEIGKAMP